MAYLYRINQLPDYSRSSDAHVKQATGGGSADVVIHKDFNTVAGACSQVTATWAHGVPCLEGLDDRSLLLSFGS